MNDAQKKVIMRHIASLEDDLARLKLAAGRETESSTLYAEMIASIEAEIAALKAE